MPGLLNIGFSRGAILSPLSQTILLPILLGDAEGKNM